MPGSEKTLNENPSDQTPDESPLVLHLTPEELEGYQPKARRPPGRPPVEEVRQTRGVRMTAREWATFQALGGSDWLREQLARAEADYPKK